MGLQDASGRVRVFRDEYRQREFGIAGLGALNTLPVLIVWGDRDIASWRRVWCAWLLWRSRSRAH